LARVALVLAANIPKINPVGAIFKLASFSTTFRAFYALVCVQKAIVTHALAQKIGVARFVVFLLASIFTDHDLFNLIY